MTLKLALVLVAVVLLAVAAFWTPASGRPHLGWAGLACFALTWLIP